MPRENRWKWWPFRVVWRVCLQPKPRHSLLRHDASFSKTRWSLCLQTDSQACFSAVPACLKESLCIHLPHCEHFLPSTGTIEIQKNNRNRNNRKTRGRAFPSLPQFWVMLYKIFKLIFMFLIKQFTYIEM